MKQPNLWYADVKLDFPCMHPAGCARRVSQYDFYDICAQEQSVLPELRITRGKFFIKK